MSRRRRIALKRAARARVAQGKALRRHARVGGAVTVSAAACALAGVGPTTAPAALASAAVLAECLTAPMPASSPNGFAAAGGVVYFAANDGIHGRELWRSDGTAAGTRMVRNIRPDSFKVRGSGPEDLTMVRGTVYFTASDGTRGRELWKSDGTRRGTVLVRNLTRKGSSEPWDLTRAGGRLFFTARDGVHGRELWKSDGTRAGTALVRDIALADSRPYELTAVGRRVFFKIDDGSHGEELWRSDGTKRGTVLVKDIDQSPLGRNADSSYPDSLTAMNGRLYFTADDGIRGRELWKSDGTRSGTTLVRNINAGAFSADPEQLTSLQGTLVFTAIADARGRELWASDGERAGTALIADIEPQDSGYYAGSYPTALTRAGERLFFIAHFEVPDTDGETRQELWTSDGTTVGTKSVKELFLVEHSEEVHVSPRVPLTAVRDRLFFSADDGTVGEELWTSDGTIEGTAMVEDIDPCQDAYADYTYTPQTVAAAGGRLFFAADDRAHGKELWVSDGTSEGTVMVKDINRPRTP